MKILLLSINKQHYNSQIVREAPCGGTEKAVIFLGESLQKLGHTVRWVTTIEEFAAGADFEPQVVIATMANYLAHFPNAYRIWWPHLLSEQTLIQNHFEAAKQYAHQTITLSQLHQQDFLTHLGIPSEIIPNGVWLSEVHPPVEKIPFSLLYCSSPERGLELVPKLFPLLQGVAPQATLTLCSSMTLYNKPEADAPYEALYRQLAAMPGIVMKGTLDQAGLYEEMARTRFFFYPQISNETYCMALDEALAHGCLPLILQMLPQSALSERVHTFSIQHMEDLLAQFQTPGPELTQYRPPADWLEVAEAWEEQVFSQIPKVPPS